MAKKKHEDMGFQNDQDENWRSARTSAAKLRIAFVLKHVAEYQLTFFENLKHLLAHRGIDLSLFYGSPSPSEGPQARLSFR